MVILTSNDLSKVDPGIRDRCEVFNFSGGRPATYFPLALRILRKEGLSVPQAELDEVVKHHCGSLRQLIRAMEAVVYGIRAKYSEAA
jgi:replication factor C subunit 3/5